MSKEKYGGRGGKHGAASGRQCSVEVPLAAYCLGSQLNLTSAGATDSALQSHRNNMCHDLSSLYYA